MAQDLILALDLGTTGNRAIVFDRSGRAVSSVYREFRQYFPKPGWVEHDAEEIWTAVRELLLRTFRQVDRRRIASIGITNQRETIVVWDRETGRPLHRAIVWQCRRTAGRCAALKKKGLEPEVSRRTGLKIDPYFSATKLAWLLENVPAAAKLAKSGRLAAGTIDSWIVFKLTGGRAHLTDSSNASRTLLFNLKMRSWDDRLCQIFGVPKSILPRVVASSGISARTASEAIGAELPIAGIVGDQQAAAFAQGCVAPGIVKNTYGTGLFLVEGTGKTIHHSKDLLTTVAWSIGGLERTEYALEGSVFIGGAAVQWLRDGLQIVEKSSDTEKLARSLPSNDGVYFVPALSGLGAPYWDPAARGLLVGLTRGTTRAHIARATLESVAYQTRDILEAMKRETRRSFRILRVDGGAAANDFLMQFQADILGIPVERPRVLQTTALGAAGLAGLASGVWKNREAFFAARKVDRIFKPRMKSSERDALYGRWKKAAARALDWES